MHSTELSGVGSVPAFITKLWRLVEDPTCDDLICWGKDGLSFFIHDQTRFAKELLPMYFKHNNMASFIRQLNMYGFRKMLHIEQGGLKSEKDTMEFYHQYFLKGQDQLLEYIKRKVSIPATASRAVAPEEVNVKPDVMHEILTDVKAIRGKQDNVDSLLNNMKRENEALWREVAFLRQKHMKQQQVVEKLIQFLVTLVQPGNRNINVVQRKLPLMLYDSSTSTNNAGPSEPKIRLTRQYASSNDPNIPNDGPVIRDVTDTLEGGKFSTESSELPEPVVTNKSLLNPGTSVEPQEQSPLCEVLLVDSPSIESPLNPDDTMEPLSILVPLQTPTSTLLMSPSDNNLENEYLNSPTMPLNLNDLVSNEKEGTGSKSVEISSAINENERVATPNLVEADTQPQPSTSNEPDMTVALNDPSHLSFSLLSPGFKRLELERSTFSDHLEGIDNELDWLTEQLSGNSLSIDTSSLLSLFGTDDTVPGNNLPTDAFRFSKGGDVTGNEVVQYLPNLFDSDIINPVNVKDKRTMDLAKQNESGLDFSLSNDPISELLGVTESDLFKNVPDSVTKEAKMIEKLQSDLNSQINNPNDSGAKITVDEENPTKPTNKSPKKKGTPSNAVIAKKKRLA